MENYKLLPLFISRKLIPSLNFFKGSEEILASIQIPILKRFEAKLSNDLGRICPDNSEVALRPVHLNNRRIGERI